MHLVTGGTGFLGSHLLFRLTNEGLKVRALKRSSSSVAVTKKIFSYYTSDVDTLFNRIEWVDGDVNDVTSLESAMKGVDGIYHCAAVVSFNKKDRERMRHINVIGTANVVNVALEQGVKRLCHVSSIASLGRAEDGQQIDENTKWENTGLNSWYSKTKYASEMEVWRGIEEGLDAVIVNPSVIFGAGDWNTGTGAIVKLVNDGLKVYTNGVNGYVDVDDVADAMVKLMNNGISGQRFILNSENLNYLDLFSILAKGLDKKAPTIRVTKLMSNVAWRLDKLKSILTGSKHNITKETARTASNKFYYDNSKIRKAIGFEFKPMAESLDFACECFKKDNARE